MNTFFYANDDLLIFYNIFCSIQSIMLVELMSL